MISTPNVRHNQLENNCKAHFFSIGNQLKKGLFTIQDVGDYIPGNLMVNDLSTNSNLYMNKSGCNILKHSREELQALGPEYFSRFFPAEEIRLLMQGLQEFVIRNDSTEVHSFLQRVRPNNQTAYKWYFTSSKFHYFEDTDNASLMHLAIEASSLNNLGSKLNRIFEENIFITQNYRKFNLLTKREKELIKLIALGHSSRDISDLLFISKHTVNNHRKNILNKLDVDCISKLVRFALAFDLV